MKNTVLKKNLLKNSKNTHKKNKSKKIIEWYDKEENNERNQINSEQKFMSILGSQEEEDIYTNKTHILHTNIYLRRKLLWANKKWNDFFFKMMKKKHKWITFFLRKNGKWHKQTKLWE